MDSIFQEFGDGFSRQNGYQLAETLTPELPNDLLREIWRSASDRDIKTILRRGIQSSASAAGFKLSHDEVQGWVEVYISYWKAIGELLAVQDRSAANGRVSTDFISPSFLEAFVRKGYKSS